jgi:hypothetical protein
VIDGTIVCKEGAAGVLFTEAQFGNFSWQMEFQLPPAGNNGLAIRYPGHGNPAYDGMCEIQILDDQHEMYSTIDPRQAHGSAYGMVAAHRGYLRPAGQWNYQVVTVDGSKITVELNGTQVLDTDLYLVRDFMNNEGHPGIHRTSGHLGFAGHGDPVCFRNLMVNQLQ